MPRRRLVGLFYSFPSHSLSLFIPSFFSSRSFFHLPASSPSTVFQRSTNAARDDNERRNPAGISARDKRHPDRIQTDIRANGSNTPHNSNLPVFFLRSPPFSPFSTHLLPVFLLLLFPPSVRYLQTIHAFISRSCPLLDDRCIFQIRKFILKTRIVCRSININECSCCIIFYSISV